MVVNNVKSRLVEGGGSVSLGHGQTNSVAHTLTEGAGGDFDSGGIMGLGVARRLAVDFLHEGLDQLAD